MHFNLKCLHFIMKFKLAFLCSIADTALRVKSIDVCGQSIYWAYNQPPQIPGTNADTSSRQVHYLACKSTQTICLVSKLSTLQEPTGKPFSLCGSNLF